MGVRWTRVGIRGTRMGSVGTKGGGHRADRPEKNFVVFAVCSLKRESFPDWKRSQKCANFRCLRQAICLNSSTTILYLSHRLIICTCNVTVTRIRIEHNSNLSLNFYFQRLYKAEYLHYMSIFSTKIFRFERTIQWYLSFLSRKR